MFSFFKINFEVNNEFNGFIFKYRIFYKLIIIAGIYKIKIKIYYII